MNLVRKYLKPEEHAPSDAGFAVIGVGLSKTGTMSLKSALGTLLDGPCYHGGCLLTEPMEHLDFWNRVCDGESIQSSEWIEMLQGNGFRAGVDLIIAAFYKELMLAFPDAKLILSERDPREWYHSAKASLDGTVRPHKDFALSTFQAMTGTKPRMDTLVRMAKFKVQPMGKSLFQAVEEGEESAVKFYQDWTAEVKRTVPKDKLLVYNVTQGWKPLCDFLEVPIPNQEFPRLNDRQSLKKLENTVATIAYVVVYGVPLILGALLLYVLRYL